VGFASPKLIERHMTEQQFFICYGLDRRTGLRGAQRQLDGPVRSAAIVTGQVTNEQVGPAWASAGGSARQGER
jgi:hypothetical protein